MRITLLRGKGNKSQSKGKSTFEQCYNPTAVSRNLLGSVRMNSFQNPQIDNSRIGTAKLFSLLFLPIRN